MSPVQLNLSNEPPCSRARVVAVVQRLTSDAHNETGSLRREYARALLADLGLPMPDDPERREPSVAPHEHPIHQLDPDPFASAPDVTELSNARRVIAMGLSGSSVDVPDEVFDDAMSAEERWGH